MVSAACVPEATGLVLSKRSLVTLSHALEDEIFPFAEPDLVVVACFQRESYFAREYPRFRAFAARCRHLIAAFHGAPERREGALSLCGLEPDELLALEWSLSFVGRETGASLVAIDRREPVAAESSLETSRSFATRLVFERPAAAAEADRVLQQLGPRVPGSARREIETLLRAAVPPPRPAELRLARLAAGVVTALEQSERRGREREEALRAEREAAQRDALTRLYNRRYLERYLGADLVHDPRPADFALLLCDLDEFKPINDELGHAAGDAALRQVAQMIEATTREGDICVRWGGDEFLVLMPHRDEQGAQAAAQRILDRLRDACEEAVGRPLTLSIGAAAGPGTAADIYRRADAALYRAKRGGRNRFALARDDAPEPD